MGDSTKRVTGIGGIFFKGKDAGALQEWYKRHLGIPVQPWGGSVFQWRKHDNPEEEAQTVWSIFAGDSEYFGRPDQAFMVNYRVDDLHAVLGELRAEGVEVIDKVEESEYGKFGWIVDPDGNRIELWEPPETPPAE